MFGSLRRSWSPRPWRGRHRVRLHCEALERRELLSAGLPTLTEVEGNDTLDQAQALGDVTGGGVRVLGAVGNGPAGAADVDWYQFTLSRAARVDFRAMPEARSFAPVLSLYNSDAFDTGDPFDPLGHRLLAQDDGASHGGAAFVEARLAPGTYYVAVSGSGNRYFNPYLADSGEPASPGPYDLLLQTTDLDLGPNDGAVVLSTSPGPAGLLNRSPFVIRADLSVALNAASIHLGQDVQLLTSPDGNFTSGDVHAVALAGYNLSTAGNELQVFPAAPLPMGYYELYLAGSRRPGQPSLTDVNGFTLGQSPADGTGQDFRTTFIVGGVEGQYVAGGAADDTPATAHALGNLTGKGVQVAGAIGDDPTDPVPFDPADVDLYHFTVSGSGRYALSAEVFAGRIGSPLNPALSLFQVGPSDHRLHLVAWNDDSLNPTTLPDGVTAPLLTEPVLEVGLTAGDYYLAVSGTGNMPDLALGLLPGTGGVFDPNVSHSGNLGYTIGDYVLRVAVEADHVPPQVVTVTPAEGTTLDAPPTQLVVQFSEPVNLPQLAFLAYEETSQIGVPAVYVQAADGSRYFPRLVSWDGSTNQATFQMLDALPSGDDTLHLSGSLGLTDLAGNPLVGNDRTGDYVVHFQVNGPSRGTDGNPVLWTDAEPNDSLSQPQDLGVLFPVELGTGNGVQIARSWGSATSDTSDFYRFQVIQNRFYTFNLNGTLPAGTQLTLFDRAGNVVPVSSINLGMTLIALLDPGTYVIEVGSWSPDQASSVAYQLWLTADSASESPPPLTSGPAPVLQMRLADVSMPGVRPPVVLVGNEAGAATPSPAVALVPAGLLRLLGSGPLGGATGADGGPGPSADGAQLARGAEFLEGGPSLALLAPAQGGGATDDRADPPAVGSSVLVLDPPALPEAVNETAPILTADTRSEPDGVRLPILTADARIEERAPAEASHPAFPTRSAARRATMQASVVPMSDGHDAWTPVLAAIAAYAAVSHRRWLGRSRTARGAFPPGPARQAGPTPVPRPVRKRLPSTPC